MAKQKTKVDKFNEILDYIKDNEELTEFVQNEIVLLNKANSNRKPTARQKENEELMVTITNEFERLTNKGFITQKEFYALTTAEVIKGLTPQRLAPMLKKLVISNILESVNNSKRVCTYRIKADYITNA